mgnify:CR=1 FL=1
MGGKRRGTLCLEHILKSSDEVVGVFGLREHPHEVKYYDSLEDLAKKHNVAFWMPENINASEIVELIKSLAPRDLTDLTDLTGSAITQSITSPRVTQNIILHISVRPKQVYYVP